MCKNEEVKAEQARQGTARQVTKGWYAGMVVFLFPSLRSGRAR
jgi:hypothetical protein